MNREIKFRIWDGKKYYYPEATKDESNHFLQFGSEGFWLFNARGEMVSSTETGGVCEQFTGLKDTNGNEVYDGDVVQFGNSTAQIEWSDSDLCFIFWHEKNQEWYGLPFFKGFIDFEVIGNTHEGVKQ